MFRVDETTVDSLPRIPAQPIGYEEAARFLEFVDESLLQHITVPSPLSFQTHDR